jgi:acetyl-CoA carboxylase biotin carboxyl carrier protein
MKIEQIKNLMEALEKSNLQELNFRDGEIKLVLKKGGTIEAGQFAPAAIPKPVEVEIPAVTTPEPAQSQKKENTDLYYLESPLVGTFYRAASPEAAPYVEVGSVVKKGDPVGIIEAMKIMNVIEAEESGVIEAIYVENAHFVEYQSKILAIKKS